MKINKQEEEFASLSWLTQSTEERERVQQEHRAFEKRRVLEKEAREREKAVEVLANFIAAVF